jgi:hypothetical protein
MDYYCRGNKGVLLGKDINLPVASYEFWRQDLTSRAPGVTSEALSDDIVGVILPVEKTTIPDGEYTLTDGTEVYRVTLENGAWKLIPDESDLSVSL